MSIDPYITGAVLMAAILFLCVAVMFMVRDRQSMPARGVKRTLRCSERQQPATVEFIERTSTGMTVRWVQSCSLWGGRRRCRQQCRYGDAPELPDSKGANAEEVRRHATALAQAARAGEGRAAEL